MGDLDIDYAQLAAQRQVLRLARQAAEELPAPEGGGGGANAAPGSRGGAQASFGYPTNDLWFEGVWATNELNGTAATLALQAPEPGVFDLFYAPGLPSPGSQGWYWVARGLFGQSSFTLTNLQGGAGFFILGTTNGMDAQGITDACRSLAGETNALSNDLNGNTIPDHWEVTFLGGLMPASTDYDGDGVPLLTEWQNGIDPNKIRFRALFDNLRVNAAAPAALTVLGGVPSQVAVLRDSTNFAAATWTAYSPTVPVDLGSSEGPHDVWIGLKGRASASRATWVGFRLLRDTAAPAVFITSPSNSTVSQPVLQLQGYSTEPLASVRYDLANDAGTLTNLEGYVTGQWFATNLLAFTTNWFECLDVPLTNGVNTITLHATDLAGNVSTTVTNYTLDYSGVTNPPALTLYWPQDGAQVSGSSFTLRGLLDDPTATVTAQITDTNGLTSEASGLVERNGLLWVERLPLAPGTNTLVLTMNNAAGLTNVMSLAVVQSDVTITIDDLSSTDLNPPFISVSGSFSAGGYAVWVNGVQATVSGDGTWGVDQVPVNQGGTAVIQARAIPNGAPFSGGGGGTNCTLADPGNPSSPQAREVEADADKPPVVVQVHYDKSLVDDFETSDGVYGETWTESVCWELNEPGSGFESLCWGEADDQYYGWNLALWDADGAGIECGDLQRGANICGIRGEGVCANCVAGTTWPGEFCEVSPSREVCDGSQVIGRDARQRSAHTVYVLRTNGKQVAPRNSLLQLTATARGVGDYFWPEMDYEDPDGYEIAPTDIRLGGLGPLGNDGRLFKALPGGKTLIVTPRVLGNPYYTMTQPSATRHKLRLWASTAMLEPGRVVSDAKFCVGQFIPFLATWAQPPAYAGAPPGVRSSSYDWVMSAKYVNRQFPSNSAGCVTYDVDPSVLTQAMPTAWYVSGGDKNVRLCLEMFFNNGQSAKLTEWGKFKVFRPSVVMVNPAFHGPPTNIWLTPWNHLCFGAIGLGNHQTNNMSYKVQVLSPHFPGEAEITQICTIDATALPPINISNELDNSNPYPNTWVFVLTNSVNPFNGQLNNIIWLDDAPNNGWVSSFHMNASFVDYVMFNPRLSGSIFVPLGKLTWSTSFGASSPSTNISPNSVTGPTGPDSSSDWPVWTHVFSNPN